MKYPTQDQVKAANRIQLARWYRFLPSPGSAYIEEDNFVEKMEKQISIMSLISKKLNSLGGITTQISKLIG